MPVPRHLVDQPQAMQIVKMEIEAEETKMITTPTKEGIMPHHRLPEGAAIIGTETTKIIDRLGLTVGLEVTVGRTDQGDTQERLTKN